MLRLSGGPEVGEVLRCFVLKLHLILEVGLLHGVEHVLVLAHGIACVLLLSHEEDTHLVLLVSARDSFT